MLQYEQEIIKLYEKLEETIENTNDIILIVIGN